MFDIVKCHLLESSLVTYIEQSEISGKKLYKQNKHYKAIANVMEHPLFREFFDQYFSSPTDIETILGFLKVYKEIEKTSPIELNGYQKLSILDNIMKDSYYRQHVYNDRLKIS